MSIVCDKCDREFCVTVVVSLVCENVEFSLGKIMNFSARIILAFRQPRVIQWHCTKQVCKLTFHR